MGKSPAFQFYPADWLGSADIMTMTPAEEGAFIRLLSIAWLQDDCGLPDNDQALARLSRLGQHWFAGPNGTAMAQPLQGYGGGIALRKKFVARGGRLYNERLLLEREKQAARRSEKSEAGKKGAAKRWKQGRYSKAIAQPKHSHSTATVLPMANDSSSSSSSSSNNPPIAPPNAEQVLMVQDIDPRPELDRIFECIKAEHPSGKNSNTRKAREQFNRRINEKPKQKISRANAMLDAHRGWQGAWNAGRFAPDLFRWIRDWDEASEPPTANIERRAEDRDAAIMARWNEVHATNS